MPKKLPLNQVIYYFFEIILDNIFFNIFNLLELQEMDIFFQIKPVNSAKIPFYLLPASSWLYALQRFENNFVFKFRKSFDFLYVNRFCGSLPLVLNNIGIF